MHEPYELASSERWLIIHRGEGSDSGPWVLAESVEAAWARDCVTTFHDSAVLSRSEALLDPDFGPAVHAWDATDDRVYGRWRVDEEAAMTYTDAVLEASHDGRLTEEQCAAWLRKGAEASALPTLLDDERAAVLDACHTIRNVMLEAIEQAERRCGHSVEPEIARLVATQAADLARQPIA